MRLINPSLFTVILIFSCVLLYGQTGDAPHPRKDIFAKYPGLSYQLERSLLPGMNKEQVTNKLMNYLASDDPELEKGMKMVLLNQLYGKYEAASRTTFVLDGSDKEWADIPDRLSDTRGNVPVPNADLVEFRSYLDDSHNLHVMFRTTARPKQTPGEESFELWIWLGEVDPHWRNVLQLKFGVNDRGKTATATYRSKTINDAFPFAVNDVAEATIPLGRIMDELGITKPQLYSFKPAVGHPMIGTVNKTRTDLTGTHADSYRGYDYFMENMKTEFRNPNYALSLLLHLVDKGCVMAGDSITPAIALANNHLYSIADGQTRASILSDMVHHFELYKKIIVWQKTLPLRVDLFRAPVIAKMHWAFRQPPTLHVPVLNQADYREFIDRIEVLEALHKLVVEKNLAEGPTLAYVTQTIFDFVMSNNTFDTTDTPEFRGKKKLWDHYVWVNFQWDRFLRMGSTNGNCKTYTMMQIAMYKAAGIAASGMDMGASENGTDYGHVFPIYYDPFLKKWNTYPQVNWHTKVKEITLTLEYPSRVRWHHRNSLAYLSEKAPSRVFESFVLRGVEEEHLERLLMMTGPYLPGSVFNAVSAPSIKPADSDGDGISDEFEIRIGTDPQNKDTDGDGFSDLWEIERGFGPKRSESPGPGALTALMGFDVVYDTPLNRDPDTADPAIMSLARRGAIVKIKNRGNGGRLCEHRGQVISTTRQELENDRWQLKATDNIHYIRIINVRTGHVLHIQNLTGYAEVSKPVPEDWWSSHWLCKRSGNGIIQQNRWKNFVIRANGPRWTGNAGTEPDNQDNVWVFEPE